MKLLILTILCIGIVHGFNIRDDAPYKPGQYGCHYGHCWKYCTIYRVSFKSTKKLWFPWLP